MSEFAVLKFGGTSAAAPEHVAEVFTADPARNRIAMLSAIRGVTDTLIGLEDAVERNDSAAVAEAQETVIEAYRSTYAPLGEKTLQAVLDRAYEQMRPERKANGYRWIGEDLSAGLFAAATGAWLVSSGLRFNGDRLNHENSLYHIYRRAAEGFGPGGRQVVMPAFYGYNKNRQEVTLPRGGSDVSAVLATAAVLQGESRSWIHENYTDKDGVMTADPAIVRDAQVIPEMTYEEVRELMHGSVDRNGVIHGDAIALAARYSVNLVVRNTFNPDCSGTRITRARDSEAQAPVIGIAGKSGIRALSLYDMGMADAVNYLTPILAEVGEDLGLSISRMPMSEDGLKLIFNGDVDDQALKDAGRFIQNHAISHGARVTTTDNQGEVYLVGQELSRPETFTETLGRGAQALRAAGLSCSEVISRENGCSLVLTVPGDDVPAAIRALHEEFIE